jgi:hypothetical protein
MRGRSKKRTGTATQGQLAQQVRFKMMSQFMRPLRSLVDITFRNYAINMTPANSALSYNLDNAVTGVYPAQSIDYSKVLLSRGNLAVAATPAAIAGAAGKMTFTWVDNSTTKANANTTDIAVLVAYDVVDNNCIYNLNGGTRSAATAPLDVSGLSGKTVQTWLLFMSADGKTISDSVFAGQVAIV